ncbi:hypothetical protein [Pseudomonas phage K4]|uniref:DprA-like DNA recombination-mediator protein n=1 Tax=Pseudomonas phage O4 TaxID=1784982 RepID=UPI00078B8B58|nr:DprA-like DNA recombination-mediator protein [Pseudomonas phage O4]AMO43504.1 hypothetical protein O4_29 [Pseudomonas phage O4]QWS69999.1 hypothetical protein [Pseudomonas phage K4]
MDNLFYSGIGSRETPEEIQAEMTRLASFLEANRFILRSGGADGADMAFENGVNDKEYKHIYLPWKEFNDNKSHRYPAKPEAFEVASKFHPAWSYLKQGAKRLHARNVHQVLGDKLDTPSKVIICWTPDGCEDGKNTSKATGGTGGAIRIATHYNIPIVNMTNDKWQSRLNEILEIDYA